MKEVLFSTTVIFTVFSTVFCCYLPSKKSPGSCSDLKQFLVSRDEWCAEAPGPMECLWAPVYYVIIHHTVSGACSTSEACSDSMKKLQKQHVKEKNWPDVGYHFVIGGDGKIYAGRPWNKMGGHTKNQNRKSIGIAFLGDYQAKAPGTEMLDLVPKIVHCGVEKGILHPDFVIIGHRDAFCSTCPGDALYAAMEKWPKFSKAAHIPSYTCDVPQTTTTTTTEATTTTTTTTESPTTTTEMATTTEKPTPDHKKTPAMGWPVYVYFLLYKKPPTCCTAE